MFREICFKTEFAKLNPRKIFGKPEFAKINLHEIRFFDLAKLNSRENLSD